MKQRGRFFEGRYGGDGLNTFLCILSWISFFIGVVLAILIGGKVGQIVGGVFYFVAIAAIILGVYRMMSRKLPARRAEYLWFRSKISDPVKGFFKRIFLRIKQGKTHRFFRCPSCRQTVRVPRGKGRIRIKCPRCGNTFEKKS